MNRSHTGTSGRPAGGEESAGLEPVEAGRIADINPSGPLRVGLVVGRPPDRDLGVLHCGVRDYAIALALALRDIGVEARVIAPRSWGIFEGFSFVQALRIAPLDVLHVQYPSIGQRSSLLPHLLGATGAARCCVVTLHEHSALPPAQRAANALFRISAHRLVFTTDFEARAFGASISNPVIPIGSNVPTHPGTERRDDTILYFGQIRAEKGLEAFIALAHLAAAVGERWRFLVMGSAPPRWLDYARGLRGRSPTNVTWIENASGADVAQRMATAAASFLPFPDGAGLRRGSMLAALANGLPVIAPFGAGTTDELRAVLFEAETPEQALTQLRSIRSAPELTAQRTLAGRRLVQRFGWHAIAERHAALYHGVLADRVQRMDSRSRR